MIHTLLLTAALASSPTSPTTVHEPPPAAVPQKGRQVNNTWDTIKLADGKEIQTRVLYMDDTVVVTRKGGKKVTEYPRAEVTEVRSVELSLRKFLDRATMLDVGDLNGVIALGELCRDNGLPQMAKLCWLYVVTEDAENETAWKALEGRQTRKGWELLDGKKWRTLADFQEFHSEWKNRMQLWSTHFILESDLPLQENIRILVTLEQLYQAFYDAMTPAIRLYSFEQLPLVQVTKDRKRYPKPPVERDAWFSPVYNALYVCADKEVDYPLIVHYITHSMLFNAFNNTLQRDGQIAMWVRQGLCLWFAGGTEGVGIATQVDLEKPNKELFQLVANQKDPTPLKRILTFAPMEFEGGPDALERSAEAYTLLYFLIVGKDGAYRNGMIEFVLDSYNGKAAPTHFRKRVNDDLDQLEKEWRAYVKLIAGS